MGLKYEPSGPAHFTQNGWVEDVDDEEPLGDTDIVWIAFALIIIGAILIWWANGHPGLEIFEDGSYLFANGFGGCLPLAICNW
jgi:hypothetical protein